MEVPLNPTPLLTLWCVCLYVIVLRMYYNTVICRTYNTAGNKKIGSFMVISMILFALTAFHGGDFFHSIEPIQAIKNNSFISEYNHYEIIYQKIAAFVEGDYWMWRLVVWGTACLLMAFTAWRLGINYKLALFIIFVMFAVQYSYARSTLAQAIYFFGVSFFIKPWKTKIINYTIGALILGQSPVFHRSMWGLVVMAPLFLLPDFVKNGKWLRTVIVMIGIVIVAIIAGRLIYTFDITFQTDEKMISKLLDTYSERGRTTGNGPSELLLGFTKHLSYCGTAFLISKTIKNAPYGKDIVIEQNLYKYYITILISSYFLLFLGDAFYTLSYRLQIMSFIPCALLVSMMWERNMMDKKTFRTATGLAITYTLLILIYAFYCAIVNG